MDKKKDESIKDKIIKSRKILLKYIDFTKWNFDKEKSKSDTAIKDKLLKKKSGKLKKYKTARIGTAFLYERIGKSQIFEGSYPILANDDIELGNYIVMQLGINKFIFLDNIIPDDWTPTRDNNIGKILHVVKFANDDYRIKSDLRGETFYKKKPVYKTQIIEQEIMTEEGKEILQSEEFVTDKEGNYIIEKHEEIKYEEPKAVTQSGREAIRIGNAYKVRMQKKREQKQSLLERYATQIIIMIVVILFCITMYMTTKMQVEGITQEWKDIREERKQGILNPESLADSIVKKQQEAEINKKAPPK